MKDWTKICKQKFTNFEIKCKYVNIGENKAYVFFVKITNSVLSESWEEISDFIALYFQNDLTSEFERWNIYLFFLVPEEIDQDLKYKIENDTFSSRKILIEGRTDIDEIIDEYILAKSISLEFVEKTEKNFEPDPLIEVILKGKELRKQRRTGEANPAFDELVKKMHSDEIQEN